MSEIQQIDQTVLDLLRRRDQETLTHIYKETYPTVRKYVTQNSGSKEDAQDIFQDAFYILIRKCEQNDFILTSSISTFLIGISKNLWLKKLTRTSLNVALYKTEIETVAEDVSDQEDEKLKQVRHMSFALTELGEPCKSILIQYYFLKQTMQEIAAAFHYTNAENAKNQKYKCLQRLKKIVVRKGE